jgi:hypothetical protein|tara:strand:+ start:341 stop:751 length:411 start_codon:yes stop_codon:yes gene_type:complete
MVAWWKPDLPEDLYPGSGLEAGRDLSRRDLCSNSDWVAGDRINDRKVGVFYRGSIEEEFSLAKHRQIADGAGEGAADGVGAGRCGSVLVTPGLERKQWPGGRCHRCCPDPAQAEQDKKPGDLYATGFLQRPSEKNQ